MPLPPLLLLRVALILVHLVETTRSSKPTSMRAFLLRLHLRLHRQRAEAATAVGMHCLGCWTGKTMEGRHSQLRLVVQALPRCSFPAMESLSRRSMTRSTIRLLRLQHRQQQLQRMIFLAATLSQRRRAQRHRPCQRLYHHWPQLQLWRSMISLAAILLLRRHQHHRPLLRTISSESALRRHQRWQRSLDSSSPWQPWCQ